jgi:uroporphyrinogen decarboxylase
MENKIIFMQRYICFLKLKFNNNKYEGGFIVTNKERVKKAINFEETDIVPHNVIFTEQIYKIIADKIGENYIDKINNHITMIELVKPQIEVKEGFFKDEYGVVWDKTGADKDIGMPASYQIATEEDFDNFNFPEVDETFVRSECERLMETDENNFRVAALGFSIFERLWTLMGIEETLVNMALEPEFIHKILRKICDRNLKILDIALEYDFDCFHFGDDWGQQKGLIMGPTYWREFIKPYIKEMYNKVKASGKYVSQHSCGDLREIMDDLYEMGLNIYQTFQPEIYGLDYSEKLYGKIAIWGGISTQHDLPYKTPQEIYEITKNTINHFKSTGGLIVAPTHCIPADVPVENIQAMVKAFLEQY